MNDTTDKSMMAKRFRGYLPVIVDVETGGFNAETDALLEIAAVTIEMNEKHQLTLAESFHEHVTPFTGANIDPKALAFNGIDPYHPFRQDKSEMDALKGIFKQVRKAIKSAGCKRAILVGHNAFFDLSFLNAAVSRCEIKRNPFHPFSTFDTVSLSGLAYGQTVLARAAVCADMAWDSEQAHSALYDAEQTARLFCKIVNEWETLSPGRWLNPRLDSD